MKPTGASDALQPGSGSAFVEAQRAAAAAANKAARDADREAALKQYPPSTPEQLAELASRYSPAQLEAIRLAEQSIDPVDLYRQGKPRPDAHTFALGQRLDEDFSTIRPVVDHRPDKGAPPVVADVPFPRRIPLLKEGEFVVDSDKWDAMSEEERKKFKEEKARVLEERAQARAKADEAAAEAESAARTEAWFKSLDPPGGFGYDSVDDIPWKDREALLGKHAPTRLDTMKFLLGDLLFNPDDQSAPALPDRVPGVGGPADLALSTASEGGGSAPAAEADEDEERIYRDVCRQTGLTTREIKSLIMKDLVVRIVSNQTRIGKVRSRYVLAVVGNGNGWLGIGEARGEIANFAGTRTKARIAAIKNMRPILRYERRTIYGNVEGKVGASVVKLFTRPPGM